MLNVALVLSISTELSLVKLAEESSGACSDISPDSNQLGPFSGGIACSASWLHKCCHSPEAIPGFLAACVPGCALFSIKKG